MINHRAANTSSNWFAVLFAGLIFLIALQIGSQRLIARDEGFYQAAAALVAGGSLPYSDFFYPQTPLLPYLYGLWGSIFNFELQTLRVLSAVFYSLGALFVLLRFSGLFAQLICLFGFAGSVHLLASFSTLQSYAASSFFMLLSFCLASGPGSATHTSAGKLFLSGMMLACAVQCRLYLLCLLPLLVGYLLICRTRKSVLYFSCGFLVCLIPTVLLYLQNPDAFIYNNWDYHQLRDSSSSGAMLANKLQVLKVNVGLANSVKFASLQLPFIAWSLIGASLFFLYRLLRKKPGLVQLSNLGLASLCGLSLAFVSFLPNPVYVQYFCLLLPFSILCLLSVFSELSNRKYQLVYLSLFMVLYVFNYPSDYLRYTSNGQGVIGINNQANAAHWNIPRINEISKQTNQLCRQLSIAKTGIKPQVLAFWPGYIAAARDCQPLPGTENHFAITAAKSLSVPQKLHYKVSGYDDLITEIRQSTPDLIVLGKREIRQKALNKTILSSKYRLAVGTSDYKIFRKL